jgi:long-subunit acyl-CoA synthetase (AMP-forming)
MKAYRKEPKKTAEAVDDDGWLHTGDVMEADEDGYLKIVDRKKELIINAAGKNMSPANIENTIKASSPLIGVILAVGDARPYNTALIVLDAESAAPYAAQRGLSDDSPETLAEDQGVIADIAAGVAEGNAKLSKVEQIKRFRVLPTFWEPGGDEITLTMKLKRKPIHQKYSAEIDALYASDIADGVYEPKAAASAAQ